MSEKLLEELQGTPERIAKKQLEKFPEEFLKKCQRITWKNS